MTNLFMIGILILELIYPRENRYYLNSRNKVNKGLSLIESFLQRLDFRFNDEKSVDKALKTAKTPKVFISHKKEDKAYADALVSMINFIIGSDGDNIFCSIVKLVSN